LDSGILIPVNDPPIPPGDFKGARSGAESTFAWFAARREAGGGPDFEAFVAEHPEQESELRALHANWSRADAASSPSAGGSAFGGSLVPGGRIGEFRLVERVGRGGMGEVWEAVQESLERTVALKLLLPGRLDERGLEFFEREARAGAKLSHSGIVTVYASGESEGVHWISMELVESRRTLADLLDDVRAGDELPAEHYGQISELVAKVADALEVAHGEGVIHRDLKPANILLDADGSPKVGDFGLARVVSEHSLSQTGDFAGTYYYMSPEQVAAKRMGIDHRTDVFSLGVVLYELLTLVRPFEGDTTHQIAKKILLDDPPDPRVLRSRVPIDLAVICGKSLEKSPDARYSTMAELAADLRRYLAHEPILARPPTMVQRAAKWVRRHPTASGVAGVATAAMVAIFLLWLRAEEEKQNAQDAEGVAEAALVTAAQQRDEAKIEQNRALKAEREVTAALEQVRDEKEATAAALETAEIERENALAAREEAARERDRAQQRAEELQQVSDFQEGQLSGVDAEAMGLTIRAMVLERARTAGQRAGREADVLEVERATLEKLLAGADFTGIALDVLDEEVIERALEELEGMGSQPLVQAQLLQAVGDTLSELGLLERALEPQERALKIRRRELGDEDLKTLTSINSLGVLLVGLGRLNDAELLLRESAEGIRRVLDDEHPSILTSKISLGRLRQAQGNLDEAERLMREALEGRRNTLGNEDPSTLHSINFLATLLYDRSKLGEAETLWREALECRRRTLGDEHGDTLVSIGNLGNLLTDKGDFDEAELLLREALEGLRRTLGDEHPTTLIAINNLGGFLTRRRRLGEAEPYFHELLEAQLRILGDEHHSTMISLKNLATLLYFQDKLDEAEPLFLQVLETQRRVLGADHPQTLATMNSLSTLLYSQGKFDEAEPLSREALEGRRRRLGDKNPQTLATINNLARQLEALADREFEAGRVSSSLDALGEAETLAREALAGTSAGDSQFAAREATLQRILTKLEQRG
jgi:hypothetical protein